MPTVSLKLIPTVNVEATETLNESGISSCNLIRFKAKLPQKLGGWSQFYPFSFAGVPRDLHPWQDLNAIDHLAVGTTLELGVITDGDLAEITPQTLDSDFSPDFTTTIGSASIEITDPNIENITTLDSVFFNTPVSVGGLILSGFYQITTVTGISSYTITAAAEATASESSAGTVPSFSTTSGTSLVQVTLADHGLAVDNVAVFPISTTVGGVTILGAYTVIQIVSPDVFSISAAVQASATTTADMNGGDAQLVYYINLGPRASGTGYGLGGYGLGGYGTGVVPDAQTGTPITATNWSLDNWGEFLLACPEGGGIYYWRPNSGGVTAGVVSTGPIFNSGIFVAMPQRILVALGSTVTEEIGVRQDPLLVRWSDILDFTNWAVTSATQAGSYRIPTGSKIIGGMQGPQQGIIWTDIDVWVMRYLGAGLVFGFNKIGSGCGLIGPHARAELRGTVFWMSLGNFFTLGTNGVRTLPCPVWDAVFQNLDSANSHKCIAAANSSFNEITFYYPSANGDGENDSYVKYNVEEQAWDYGSLARSTWTDQSVLGEPIGASPTGVVFQHETSPDAAGQPLNSWFETGYFVIAEGRDFAFVDWFFPDMKFGNFNGTQNAQVLVTITKVDYPNGTETSYGPFTMTSAQAYVNTRLRGRQIKLRFESNDLGSFWRLGNMRYRVAQDGRR